MNEIQRRTLGHPVLGSAGAPKQKVESGPPALARGVLMSHMMPAETGARC